LIADTRCKLELAMRISLVFVLDRRNPASRHG
jgi:hypothetical protein